MKASNKDPLIFSNRKVTNKRLKKEKQENDYLRSIRSTLKSNSEKKKLTLFSKSILKSMKNINFNSGEEELHSNIDSQLKKHIKNQITTNEKKIKLKKQNTIYRKEKELSHNFSICNPKIMYLIRDQPKIKNLKKS